MKTVFCSNEEVCHIWASQSQEYGEAGNISFRNGTIYSYSTAMGHILDNVVLLNEQRYSVTTSAHQGLMSQAVSHMKRFYVASVSPDHDVNIACYVSKIKDSFGKYFRARDRKVWQFDDNHANHQALIDYANHFGVKYPASIGAFVLAETDEAARAQKDRYDKSQRQERLAAKTAIDKIELAWIRGKSNQRTVEVNGKTYDFNTIRLRITLDNEIQSSLGAKVPFKDDKRLYRLIKRSKPVHGEKIGHYTVTGFNGSLKIGCHNISRTEIDRLAKSLGW